MAYSSTPLRATVLSAGIPATPHGSTAGTPGGNGDVATRMAQAESSTCPDELTSLAADPSPRVVRKVAANPHTPVAVLHRLFHAPGVLGLGELALNPAAPLSMLAALLAAGGPFALAVLRNPSLPVDVLRARADLDDQDVCASIAANPSCPPDLLTALSAHDEGAVRVLVAENPATPPEVLTRLSFDSRDYIAVAVAENRSTPEAVLADLALDPTDSIAIAVAGNPSTPADALLGLADPDSHPDVHRRVALNPSTPTPALHLLHANRLAETKGPLLAGHPNADAALLTALVEDPNSTPDTVSTAVAHPACPEHLRFAAALT